MSKNKKKNKYVDYFNMTPEEQMANAEMFHEVETGEASFLDALNYKVPTGPIAQSDYTRQIERACLGIVDNTQVKEDDSDYLSNIDSAMSEKIGTSDDDNKQPEHVSCLRCLSPHESILYNSSDYVKKDEEDDDEYNIEVYNTPVEDDINDGDENTEDDYTDEEVCSYSDGLPRIQFNYNSDVNRMIIDDGYVATPVSVMYAASTSLDKNHIPNDADSFGETISKIFFYIISCKHPAVIMTENVFEIEMSIFESINYNKFIFFKNKGYIYAYILEEGEIDKFYSISDTLNINDEYLLRYAVGAAFAANTMHNIFMYNDEYEVETVMTARHDVKGLINLIEKDPETKYAGHNVGYSTMNRMKVTDLQTMVSDVRNLLNNLLEYDEDDDEDIKIETDTNCDNIDYDDYDIISGIDAVDINDFPDIDDAFNTTKTTTVSESTTIKTNDTSDNDDMTVPVIHRR